MIRRAKRNKRKSTRHDARQDCLWKLTKSRKTRPKNKIKNEIFG